MTATSTDASTNATSGLRIDTTHFDAPAKDDDAKKNLPRKRSAREADLRTLRTISTVEPSSPVAGKGPKRVLVADDDADVCALLRAVLAPLAVVTTVADAEAARELIAEEPPFDAIISDFMLPGITGLEFVKRVRDDECAHHIPILMISGHGACEVGERARAAGADAFLDKPFTLTQLRAVVRHLLRGSRVRFA